MVIVIVLVIVIKNVLLDVLWSRVDVGRRRRKSGERIIYIRDDNESRRRRKKGWNDYIMMNESTDSKQKIGIEQVNVR